MAAVVDKRKAELARLKEVERELLNYHEKQLLLKQSQPQLDLQLHQFHNFDA